MERSFYMLESWVGPGGARKADYYLFSSVEEIKQALVNDVSPQNLGPYLVLWYGEAINLYVYREGKLVWQKDLHPYITFYVPGYPPLQGTATGSILDVSDRGCVPAVGRDEDDDEQENLREELMDILWEGEGIRVEIDWAGIGIPELEGPLLQPGEVAMCMETYTEREGGFTYGYHSLE